MSDKIKIDILPDGTLRITTDKVSAPNHMSAEKLIGDIAKDAGGKPVKRVSRNATNKQSNNQSQNQ